MPTPDYPTTGADAFERRVRLGKPNGYASLDANGHVPAAQIVDIDAPGGTGTGTGGGIAPSGTVAAGVLYGLIPYPGASLAYSPGDHSHGTPPAPGPSLPPVPVESSTAPAIVNGGTIATAGLTSSRISPTSNITGAILNTISTPAQSVFVLNESIYSVTFAAAGTSHVSIGTACVIPAQSHIQFVWDSMQGMWYPPGGAPGIPIPPGTTTYGGIAGSGATYGGTTWSTYGGTTGGGAASVYGTAVYGTGTYS